MSHSSEHVWASEIFGHAQLGDVRRTRRLVAIAAAAAHRPSGTVTGMKQDSAGSEGTFRFLENAEIPAAKVASAVFEATAALATRDDYIYVPVDQSDLTFTDRMHVRGLGPDCSRRCNPLRSVQVMSALALDACGVPIGLLDQQWWNRPEEKTSCGSGDQRAPEERESWQWVRTLEAAQSRLDPHTRACYVMDRGADFWGVFETVERLGIDAIVRANHPRVIRRHGQNRGLWSTLARAESRGLLSIRIPAGHGRRARTAQCEVRSERYSLRMRDQVGATKWHEFTCLRLREIGPIAHEEERLEWKLLTTLDATEALDIQRVIEAYTYRWRIEEFHKTWKSGACNVEDSQLRSYEAIVKWATVLGAVATRVERLKLLSRTTPDISALLELSRDEIDAAIILTKTKKHKVGDDMTLQQAVRLIAMAGGFMGRKGDGNPGSITIQRGLDDVLPAARALAFARRCD